MATTMAAWRRRGDAAGHVEDEDVGQSMVVMMMMVIVMVITTDQQVVRVTDNGSKGGDFSYR